MNKTLQRTLHYLPLILIGLALLAFIGYFVIYNVYAFALFHFPFDYDQGEGFELVDTILFSRGQWPYRDNDVFPFYSSNYPPIYHLAIVPLIWLFGPKYWTGRIVSYAGTLVTAAVISYAVQRKVNRWWLAAIAGLAYLASNYIYHVGPLFRQHLFMVMFEVMAVVAVTVIYELEEKRGKKLTRWLIVAMALLLLAGYTKQLAYATVIAVFGFMLLRDWKRAIRYALPFGFITGMVFGYLVYFTNGEWFTATVTANINEFIPGQASGLFWQWFRLHRIMALAAACYAVYELYYDRLSLYSIWWVLATVNSLTAGKWGAGESYFATAIAASCILMGLGFGRILNRTQSTGFVVHRVALIGVALLLLNQANRVFHMPTHTETLRTVARALGKPTETYVAPQTGCSADRPAQIVPYVDTVGPTLLGRPPSADDRAAGDRILSLVGDGGLVFAEEAAFNLWAGRPVITNPTQLYNLALNNAVDLTDMLAMINGKQFHHVIFRAQLFPGEVLQAIGQNYHQTHLVEMNGFVYCIYSPNQ